MALFAKIDSIKSRQYLSQILTAPIYLSSNTYDSKNNWFDWLILLNAKYSHLFPASEFRWSIRTLDNIAKRTFVMEYIGLVSS